jgi:hypothetical protein
MRRKSMILISNIIILIFVQKMMRMGMMRRMERMIRMRRKRMILISNIIILIFL